MEPFVGIGLRRQSIVPGDAVAEASAARYQGSMERGAIRIIGIDPGLQRTGWGVIDVSGNSLAFVAAGTVRSQANTQLAHRLKQLHEGLSQILAQHLPQEAAVENTFVSGDGAATLKLGQARGVALLAPALLGLEVAEYAPNTVKKTVTGVGHGDKNQIKAMVDMLLLRARYDSADAADALAIAICHAHHRNAARLKARIAAQ
jgi:crossover junction endodeoxyribonuclease RuvC